MTLLDSSILIRVLRKVGPPEIDERVSELVAQREAAINGAIRAEVLVGCKSPADFDKIDRWLDALEYFDITAQTWTSAARLGFDLRRAGVAVGLPDLIIAASAIDHQAVLMHADSDFDRIAARSKLQVESLLT